MLFYFVIFCTDNMILSSITKPCSREKKKDSRNEDLITCSVFKLLVISHLF